MANKTINGITTELDSVANADLFPVWDASEGKTAKVTKSNFLGLDNYPTANSNNPAKSSGIFSANAVIMATSTTITNAPTISSGSIIRVMFTSAITGSDTTTALSLSYNGTSYSVKVGKQGSLANFVASYVNSAYTYLQAYTTLELAFDGTQFIIIGNPVVLSSSDYTIYADGVKTAISANWIEDDFGLNYLSGSTFMQKYYPTEFRNAPFYVLEMTAIEKVTGRSVSFIYRCKKDTSANYQLLYSNGLSYSDYNVYGTIQLTGLQAGATIIQRTKVITIVENGTYYANS